VNTPGKAAVSEVPPEVEVSITPRVGAAVRAALGGAFAGPHASGRRVVAALLGRGIGASRTPGMHEAEGARLGLRYAYGIVDFDLLGLADKDLEATVEAARALGLNGLNITHPFKEAVVSCLDALSSDASDIGAVNTVVFSEGRAMGHNTDSHGFSESFRRSLPGARLEQVLLIGSGGAGMAVAHSLLALGASSLQIFDRVPDKAKRLAGRLARRFPDRAVAATGDLVRAASTASGIVNATPSGMAKYPGSPLAKELLHPRLWVADIVYFPTETALIRAAQAAGCRTVGGSGMAVFQAVQAFELISGVRADPEQMARHFAAVPVGESAPAD
jgi:shikimate dehydrogenase